MLLRTITEKFYKADKLYSDKYGKQMYTEVFKNPSQKEADEIVEKCGLARFSTDIEGNLYVWDGNIFHSMASKIVPIDGPFWGAFDEHEIEFPSKEVMKLFPKYAARFPFLVGLEMTIDDTL